MKFSTVFGAALVAQGASAHYFFEKTTYAGQSSNAFQYIRDFTRPTKFNPIKFSSNPAADIRDGSTVDGPDIRCNQGAFSKAGSTQVLTVTAGTEIKMTLGVGATMQHPGPSLVYMSRAPGDNVKAYDGSGDWFKIMEEGVCNQGADFTRDAWCSWDKNSISATIPKNTPNGEYLLRVEHIGVHRSHVNQPEHYTSCVQVKVTGGGNGTPGPLVKFPGAYTAKDAYANFSIYNGFKAFPMPGPKVWSGGSSSGSTAPSTGGSTAPSTGGSTAPSTGGSTAPSTGGSTAPSTGGSTAPSTGGNTGACAALWAQCGGQTFTGAKCCSTGSCKFINPWYSQCHN